MKKKFETRAIHIGQKPEKLYGSISLPIYQTSTFKQEEFGEYTYYPPPIKDYFHLKLLKQP